MRKGVKTANCEKFLRSSGIFNNDGNNISANTNTLVTNNNNSVKKKNSNNGREKKIKISATSKRVRLFFRADKIVDLDTFTVSDPYLVLYSYVYGSSGKSHCVELGRTEVISNNLSPVFTNDVELVYHFDARQQLSLVIYHDEGKSDDGNRICGTTSFYLSEVITAKNKRKTFNLNPKGTVTVDYTNVSINRSSLEATFRGVDLFTGVSTGHHLLSCQGFFFTFSSIAPNGARSLLYKSEAINGQEGEGMTSICSPLSECELPVVKKCRNLSLFTKDTRISPGAQMSCAEGECGAIRTSSLTGDLTKDKGDRQLVWKPIDPIPLCILGSDHLLEFTCFAKDMFKDKRVGSFRCTVEDIKNAFKTKAAFYLSNENDHNRTEEEAKDGGRKGGNKRFSIKSIQNFFTAKKTHPSQNPMSSATALPNSSLSRSLPSLSPSFSPPLSGHPSPRIYVEQFSGKCLPSFTEFLSNNWQINIAIAIDFSLSNGDFSDENRTSLHYTDPFNGDNLYITAISSVCEIIQEYDRDKQFAAFGFGAAIDDEIDGFFPLTQRFLSPRSKASLLSPISSSLSSSNSSSPSNNKKGGGSNKGSKSCSSNKGSGGSSGEGCTIGDSNSSKNKRVYVNEVDPYVDGVEGLIRAYADTVPLITKQHEAPEFAPVIKTVTKMARKAELNRVYTFLLILTSGEIKDMAQTINEIIDADDAPLSIVIIGVGDRCDFSNMVSLDADDSPLCSVTEIDESSSISEDNSGKNSNFNSDNSSFAARSTFSGVNLQNLTGEYLTRGDENNGSSSKARGNINKTDVKKVTRRDLVQFVHFSEFMNKNDIIDANDVIDGEVGVKINLNAVKDDQNSVDNKIISRGRNKEGYTLAEAVLQEIPRQFEEYADIRGIMPTDIFVMD